jgi:hypothetical protein
MEISNNQTWYINPNNRALTSNIKNTEIKDREAFKECMQKPLRPVEDLVSVLKTPINLADATSVNRQVNSVTIAEGARIAVNDGYYLVVKSGGVECLGENANPYDMEAYEKAQALAGAFSTLLRNAGGTLHTVAYGQEAYQKWTEQVSTVMQYLDIDITKDFTINGMKYSKNEKGDWESSSNSIAKAAYERQKAANRTYEFADEKTRKQIAYMSDYYLSTVPEDVKDAWQATLEETGINPFPNGYASTLAQLSVEQDFQTGGNYNIFGDTLESSIAAVQSILERIDNPLAETKESDYENLQNEKEFYSALLANLQK